MHCSCSLSRKMVVSLPCCGGGSCGRSRGSGAGVCMYTLGVNAGVGAGAGACNTLGVDAGVVTRVVWATGGMVNVVGVLKIAQRLLTAMSWAWQLSCVRSAHTVTFKALRQ